MKSQYIKIIEIEDLSNFVAEASKVPGMVLVKRGKFCIDGKSLLGMMFINSREGCRVEYPENAIEFEKYITKFAI